MFVHSCEEATLSGHIVCVTYCISHFYQGILSMCYKVFSARAFYVASCRRKQTPVHGLACGCDFEKHIPKPSRLKLPRNIPLFSPLSKLILL